MLADRRDYNIRLRYLGKSKQPLPANWLINELDQKEPKLDQHKSLLVVIITVCIGIKPVLNIRGILVRVYS